MTEAAEQSGRPPHPVLASTVIVVSLAILFLGFRHARLDRETLEAGQVLDAQVAQTEATRIDLLAIDGLPDETRQLIDAPFMSVDLESLGEQVVAETVAEAPYVHTLNRYVQLVELTREVVAECEARRDACEQALSGIGAPLRMLGRHCTDPCSVP